MRALSANAQFSYSRILQCLHSKLEARRYRSYRADPDSCYRSGDGLEDASPRAGEDAEVMTWSGFRRLRVATLRGGDEDESVLLRQGVTYGWMV